MKALAITGLIHTEDFILNNLVDAGLALDFSTATRTSTIAGFHSELFKSQGLNPTGMECLHPLEPGEEWLAQGKQLLTDLMDNHIAWADDRTTFVLEFWNKVEPDLGYVLLYRSPWSAIDKLLRQDIKTIDSEPETVLTAWLHYNRSLLNFYLNQREKCLLLNADFVEEQYSQFLGILNDRFGLQLESDVNKSPDVNNENITADSIYAHILADTAPEAIELYIEMESCATLLGRDPDFSCQDQLYKPLTADDLLSQWSGDCKKETSYQKLLDELNDTVINIKADRDTIQTSLADADDKKNSLQRELEKTIKDLDTAVNGQKELEGANQSLKEKNNTLQSELKEAQEEAELLLLQLHQVQEELEHYFLLNQDNEKHLQEKTTELEHNIQLNQENKKKLNEKDAELNKYSRLHQDARELLNDYKTAIISAKDKLSKLYKIQHTKGVQ